MTRDEIVKKYIRIVKIGGKWNTYFQVGAQGFNVCGMASKKKAEWYAEMLGMAIEAILLDEIEARNKHGK